MKQIYSHHIIVFISIFMIIYPVQSFRFIHANTKNFKTRLFSNTDKPDFDEEFDRKMEKSSERKFRMPNFKNDNLLKGIFRLMFPTGPCIFIISVCE